MRQPSPQIACRNVDAMSRRSTPDGRKRRHGRKRRANGVRLRHSAVGHTWTYGHGRGNAHRTGSTVRVLRAARSTSSPRRTPPAAPLCKARAARRHAASSSTTPPMTAAIQGMTIPARMLSKSILRIFCILCIFADPPMGDDVSALCRLLVPVTGTGTGTGTVPVRYRCRSRCRSRYRCRYRHR